MKAPARRSISYVVEGHDEQRAHRLGVNSLVIDPNVQTTHGSSATGGILYSAGRDGVVASWDLHLKYQRGQEQDISTDEWVFDQEFQQSAPKATCRAFSQMHTDWVNDIALCDNGRFVVSASSDRTVKLWSTRENDTPNNAYTIGWHTDYVKCLASAHKAGWVASGGLDKKINIWDIDRCQAALTINPHGNPSHEQSEATRHATAKASIYAMAVNPSGTFMATGSPDKVVRLWDPRSGRQVGKLTGHTDNIRALLISHDGSHILSGSSDSTIKFWSARAQRCLATYETHNDSVWALYSDDPELRTFYAGSRDGLVTKTEVSGHGDVDTDESECIGLFKEKSGVAKIAVFNDTFVWTATSSSDINRWLSIPSRESRQLLTRSAYNTEIPLSASAKLPPPQPTFHSQYAEPFIGSDNLTVYARSVMSIPISYHEDDDGSEDSIQPLRSTPDCVIEGKPGISTHLVLQNRRHVLTKDTNGEVALWDVVKCMQIKNFGQRELDSVAQDVNGMDSFPAWCTVDTKIGAITVQLDGFTCFDCEMYTDEIDVPDTYEVREDQRINLGKWVLVHLFAGFLEKSADLHKNEEQRVHYEGIETPTTATPGIHPVEAQRLAPKAVQAKISDRNLPKPPLTAITTNIDNSPFHPTSPGSPTNLFKGPFTAPPSTSPQHDYFSGAHHVPNEPHSPVQPPPPVALSNTPTSPTSSNFINRLKHLSVKGKMSKSPSRENHPHDAHDAEKSPSANNEKPVQQSSEEEAKGSKAQKQASENGKSPYTPPSLDDFPPLSIPRSTTIIIAEESAEASTGMDLYRGTVATSGIDSEVIAQTAPSWLLNYLYHNKIPTKETVKLTFALKPCADSVLPELPGGPNNRLLANRVLRVRKLVQYIVEKLDISTSDPDEQVELLCADTVLAPTMTLAAIRQHIMKSGGDINLSYRYVKEGLKLASSEKGPQ